MLPKVGPASLLKVGDTLTDKVYTYATCLAACQAHTFCYTFEVGRVKTAAKGKCRLYGQTRSLENHELYNFYSTDFESPNNQPNVCTHLDIHAYDKVKVQECKDQSTESNCGSKSHCLWTPTYYRYQ